MGIWSLVQFFVWLGTTCKSSLSSMNPIWGVSCVVYVQGDTQFWGSYVTWMGHPMCSNFEDLLLILTPPKLTKFGDGGFGNGNWSLFQTFVRVGTTWKSSLSFLNPLWGVSCVVYLQGDTTFWGCYVTWMGHPMCSNFEDSSLILTPPKLTKFGDGGFGNGNWSLFELLCKEKLLRGRWMLNSIHWLELIDGEYWIKFQNKISVLFLVHDLRWCILSCRYENLSHCRC